MELANQDKIRMPGEKETYKYVRILEADTIKQVEKKIKKEYLRTTRKILEIKLYSRNLIKYLSCSPRKIFGTILEVDDR